MCFAGSGLYTAVVLKEKPPLTEAARKVKKFHLNRVFSSQLYSIYCEMKFANFQPVLPWPTYLGVVPHCGVPSGNSFAMSTRR